MLSGKSFIKIRNRIGLKTKLCGTPDNTACVHDSQLIQVADDVHKLNQLGLPRPLTLETMLTVSKYAI